MNPRPEFNVVLAPEALQQIKALERRHHSLIFDKIDEQLLHEPHVQTRNRKPLEGFTLYGKGAWELRFGSDNCFRVFYGFDVEELSVEVFAVGIKQGSRLFIGGKEIVL